MLAQPNSFHRLDVNRVQQMPAVFAGQCGGRGQRQQASRRGVQAEGAPRARHLRAPVPTRPAERTARRQRRPIHCRQAPRRALALALLLLAAMALPAGRAMAHEVRPIIATLAVEQGGAVEIGLSLNLEAAMAGIAPEHANTDDSATPPVYDRLRGLPPQALAREFGAFEQRFLAGLDIAFDGRPASLTVSDLAIPPVGDPALPRISELVLTGVLADRARTLTWRLDRALGDSVVRLRGPGSDQILRATYVPAGETAGPLTLEGALPQRWTEVFATYLRIGFIHIVPRGLDHVLFVIGLFLLSTRLSALLWQVSAFTVAHTVTLGLGALGIVTLSPAIVEPLIALSIAWVAIENLVTDRLHRWRPVVVFCFGLLHGLGFAGVLGEIGLDRAHFVAGLLAFNIGVELGQLTVIAACFLAVGWAMRRRLYRELAVIPASAGIAFIALYWTVERLGLT